ncbi:MAG TPA: hypothetical protein DGG95_02600, partial [Cytophagales bacterium]|nr:hypothetical protein [Cytophagales bacterium]
MILKKYFVFCLLLLFVHPSFSQTLSSKNKKAIELYTEADNYRVRGQYDQAIDLLQQAIRKDKNFEEAYYRLGFTYRSAGNRPSSIEYFEKGLAVSSTPAIQKSYYFDLTEDYLRTGQYEKAKASAEKYLIIEKSDKAKIDKVLVWKSQTEYGLAHKNENVGYVVKPLSDTINKYPMQYFPAISADGQELIFTVRYGLAHDDNEDIFISKNDHGHWMIPTSLSENINTSYREGACSISADGRHLIFTICGPRGCDVYESKKEGEVWRKPVSLGPNVNSNSWEAQPSLSADGNELYFVSDRKGGIGGYDIWYSRKDSLGRWSRAVNVGRPINTRYNEIAPYIHVNNRNLYYASDGLPGFGGLDVYVSEKDQQWSEPKNMGAPLNDFEDQYSFVVTSDGANAYYSREQGRMRSQIYKTNIPEALRVRSRGNVVKGIVTDAQTKKPLRSSVELFDLKTNKKISVFTSDSINGYYLIVVPGKSEYALHVA